MSKRNWQAAAWPVALALLVGLPFLGKPFHIDDPVVLAIARQVLHHPGQPFAGQLNWFDRPQPIFAVTTNPPLLSYWLAPVLAACGLREVPLHVAMLPFLVILALATASLSRRFAGGSAWPVLLVMLSPAVVVSSNLMRDVPAAALAAAALALFVAGVDRERWPLALAGSLLVGLAMLTKYSSVMLFVVAAGYLLVQGRRRWAWTLLPGLGLVGLWCLQNWLTAGQTHLGFLWATQGNPAGWQERLWPLFVTVGPSLLVFPALLAALAAGRQRWALAGCLLAGALVPLAALRHLGQAVSGQYLLWSAAGALLLAALAAGALSRPAPEGASRRDDGFLLLWAALVLAFGVWGISFQAVRHLIPALVPMALLATRQLAGLRARWVLVALAGLVLLQGALAFAVAAADYEYAGAYRRFARQAQAEYAGQRVWFSGHWGWQVYAQEAGFRQVSDSGPAPTPGDLLIIPDRVYKGMLPPGLESHLLPVKETVLPGRIPLRVMDGYRAGFYATGDGLVPFTFTRERELEVFRIYLVTGEGHG